MQLINAILQATLNFMYFPSSSCHRRRIQAHNPHVLVSCPATLGFNPKSMHHLPCLAVKHSSFGHVLATPATRGFNPKSMHHLPCPAVKHSSFGHVLATPATRKINAVPSALPRHIEFSSDNEEEPMNQEQSNKVSDGEVKKMEFVVREATVEEFEASACLKAGGLYHYDEGDRYVDIYKLKNFEQEYDSLWTGYMMRALEPFMCIIAVRNEGEHVPNDALKNVIGTLDFRVKYLLQGETYPEELVKPMNLFSSKKRGSEKYDIISNVTVAGSACQQGVGSSMLKFAIETAKEDGKTHRLVGITNQH
ncbi:hypothetical protein C5167_002215, partial [Papaver somniferum]